MLSLSPRYDLCRFEFPRTFFPDPIWEKYQKILRREPAVFNNPRDYLNESIKGITFPGISELVIQQNQHSTNLGIEPTNSSDKRRNLGRLNVEPNQNNSYKSALNPLDKIDRNFRVTFNMNQNMMNYFMIMEIIFYVHGKHLDYEVGDNFSIFLPNEEGTVIARIDMFQCLIEGIDGLEFSYDKITRDAGTFSVNFKYNNIDYKMYDNDMID